MNPKRIDGKEVTEVENLVDLLAFGLSAICALGSLWAWLQTKKEKKAATESKRKAEEYAKNADDKNNSAMKYYEEILKLTDNQTRALIFERRYIVLEKLLSLNKIRNNVSLYLDSHPSIPDSLFVKKHFIALLNNFCNAKDVDFQIIATLCNYKIELETIMPLLFERVVITEYLSDLNILIEILMKAYDEENIVLEDIDDSEFLSWFNTERANADNQVILSIKRQMSVE